jgi:hypothetical protein
MVATSDPGANIVPVEGTRRDSREGIDGPNETRISTDVSARNRALSRNQSEGRP